MTGRGARAVLALLVVALALPGHPGPAAAGTGTPDCDPGPSPYQGVPGADLRPEVHVSADDEPVAYVLWRGTVRSFDGLPLSVDVTVPCGHDGPLPTVVMLHGFTDDKTVWEETGKGDRVTSSDRPGANSRWNNIWFASRGYAVLTYTARGWRDSCGPDTPGGTGDAPPSVCAPYEHWIHLDDVRWEVRDAQWLTGGLVQGGAADHRRLAITGGSYGGAPSATAALLDDRVVCGADPVPPDLGSDPCLGRADDEMAPWTTPDGEQGLTWSAALPLYTFADLIQVLAPNGRWSDGWAQAPLPGDPTSPFGVPLDSTVSGLLLVAGLTGRLAPPGGDPASDVEVLADRLLAGNPFPADDPLVALGVGPFRDRRSPVAVTPQGRVPIFWAQGFTDALFPGSEALTMLDHLRSHDPAYPVKVFLGDFGHDYAAERVDEWDLVKEQMNAFIDHHLRPDRTPTPPTYDVGATITRCLDPDAPVRYVTAEGWHDLHPDHRTFTSDEVGRTSTPGPGPAGAATDPISTATLPGPDSYKGCRTVRPSVPDPTVATYEFPLDRDLELMGAPVVEVAFDTTGEEVPLSVRIWDVAPGHEVQGLVTRGTHRVDGPAGEGRRVRFQVAPQGYRFPAGHTLKVEVTADDSPYLQASNVPAEITVRGLEVTVPVLDPAVGRSQPAEDAQPERKGGNDADRWWVVAAAIAAAVGLLVAAWTVTRRRR